MSGLGTSRRIPAHRKFAALSIAALLSGALARPASATQPPTSLTAWISADFDGDRKPDLARTGAFHSDGNGFLQEISLRFSAADSGTFIVRTPAIAYRLVARDVDGDSDRDLILETLFREPLAILLNDGGGHFHEGRVEDFGYLFSRRERSSWEAARRLSPDTVSRDASQNDVSVARVHIAFAELTSTGAADNPNSLGSSAILRNPSTRGPPAF